MFSKVSNDVNLFEVEEQISTDNWIKLCSHVWWFSVNFFCILFNSLLGNIWHPEVSTDGIKNNYNTWFSGSQHLTSIVLVNKYLKSQVCHHVLSWIQNSTRLSLISLCGWIRVYLVIFKLISGTKLTPSFHSKKGNEISIDDVWMGNYVSCQYKKEWYDGINEEVSVEENDTLDKKEKK